VGEEKEEGEEQREEEEEEKKKKNSKILLQKDGTPPHFVIAFRHPFIESFHLMDWQRRSPPWPHFPPYCIPVDFDLFFWGYIKDACHFARTWWEDASCCGCGYTSRALK
jgi:hypothetical protein